MTGTEGYGLILALAVGAVALLFVGWNWAEHRQPIPLVADDDVAYFYRQKFRRHVVAGIMMVLAALIFVGSRTDHRLHGRPNVVFVVVWMAVFGLVLLLLVLASVDWLATRRFARRTRSAIVREGMELLKEEMRQRAREANPKLGSGNGALGE